MRRLLAAVALTVAITAPVVAHADVSHAVAYDCHVRSPHPPLGTFCVQGVWVRPATPDPNGFWNV